MLNQSVGFTLDVSEFMLASPYFYFLFKSHQKFGNWLGGCTSRAKSVLVCGAGTWFGLGERKGAAEGGKAGFGWEEKRTGEGTA